MMSDPIASVVMSVRNGESFLSQAIRSVQRQTLRNIELIVVDDGSTDASAEIVRDHQRTDSRIVLLSVPGLGLAAALNTGINSASGRWIARMDADDISLPGRLEQQVSYAVANNLDVCGADVKTFGATVPRTRRHYETDAAIKLQLLFNSPFTHPAVLIKATVSKNHRYDVARPAAQDYCLWTRLAIAGTKMGNLPRVVLRYRVHGRQTTLARNDQQVDVVLASATDYWRWAFARTQDVNSPGFLRCLRALVDKRQELAVETAEEVLQFLRAIFRESGDPERVISTNAYYLLVRLAASPARAAVDGHFGFKLSGFQRLTIRALALSGVQWQGKTLELIRRRLR